MENEFEWPGSAPIKSESEKRKFLKLLWRLADVSELDGCSAKSIQRAFSEAHEILHLMRELRDENAQLKGEIARLKDKP